MRHVWVNYAPCVPWAYPYGFTDPYRAVLRTQLYSNKGLCSYPKMVRAKLFFLVTIGRAEQNLPIYYLTGTILHSCFVGQHVEVTFERSSLNNIVTNGVLRKLTKSSGTCLSIDSCSRVRGHKSLNRKLSSSEGNQFDFGEPRLEFVRGWSDSIYITL